MDATSHRVSRIPRSTMTQRPMGHSKLLIGGVRAFQMVQNPRNRHVGDVDHDPAPGDSIQSIRQPDIDRSDQPDRDRSMAPIDRPPRRLSAANEEQQSTNLFVDRVSIAGLQEAFGHRSRRTEKILFRVALLIAAFGIVYESYITVKEKYVNQGQVFDDFDVVGAQAPFPNITICGPEAIKLSGIRKLVEERHDLSKHPDIDLQKIFEELRVLISFNLRPKPMTKILARLLSETARVALNEDLQASGLEMYKSLYPRCEDLFSHCTFETYAFNCCDVAELMLFDERVCYHFALSEYTAPDDAIHVDQSGFSIHAHIDWSDVLFWDDLAIDGFNVFIGPLPAPWHNPLAIPAAMDARIVLAPPQQVTEMSGCQSEENLPKMHYAKYYDPYAVGCVGEKLSEQLMANYGCMIPGLNYGPENGTGLCTPEQGRGLSSIFNGEAFKVETGRLARGETMLRDNGQIAFRQCPQFCSRYTYSVISASYGSIKDQKEATRTRAAYHIHSEKAVSPGYMAVCEIGGFLGVYAGMSMLTVIQAFAYGFWMCVKRKRRVRVGAIA